MPRAGSNGCAPTRLSLCPSFPTAFADLFPRLILPPLGEEFILSIADKRPVSRFLEIPLIVSFQFRILVHLYIKPTAGLFLSYAFNPFLSLGNFAHPPTTPPPPPPHTPPSRNIAGKRCSRDSNPPPFPTPSFFCPQNGLTSPISPFPRQPSVTFFYQRNFRMLIA